MTDPTSHTPTAPQGDDPQTPPARHPRGSASVWPGDCLELLACLPDNSIDAIVTDPPYGIGFMGHAWDTFTPGAEQARVVENRSRDGANPNVRGRRRSPAASPSAVEYDRSLAGQRAFQAWTERWGREALRVLKPGGHAVVFGAPRAMHRAVSGLEEAGFETRDMLLWQWGSGFPKSLDVSKAIDKAAGVSAAGDAVRWAGFGTALKPAYEPIVLCRKPLAGTVAQNVLTHGTGALNIDGCRVGGDAAPDGRWPPNLLHDGSPEVMATFPARAGAASPVTGDEPSPASRGAITGARARVAGAFHADAGSAARFFPSLGFTAAEGPDVAAILQQRALYQPKTARSERHYGCEMLPVVSAGEMTGGRKEGSAGLNSPRAGAGRTGGGGNAHSTVKPIRLMRWLCRLITPPGGIILDPFLGSGTTAIAAVLEGFECIGMEREAAWVTLAETRIAAWSARPDGHAVTEP